MTDLDRAINNFAAAVDANCAATDKVIQGVQTFLETEKNNAAELRRGIEKLQARLDSFPASVPHLPEGKAACARLSCQRICPQEELSERGWCPQCERLDLTRAQMRNGKVV